MRVEAVNLSQLYVKWQGGDEGINPRLGMGVLQLEVGMVVLERLTEDQFPTQWHIRVNIQVVGYIMGDAICIGFGLVLWYRDKIISYAGKFTPLQHGMSSNFLEGYNLTTSIEYSAMEVQLRYLELFVFAQNLAFGRFFYQCTSNSPF